MENTTKKIAPITLAKEAARLFWGKKGKKIVVLNVHKLTTIADYIVIGTVESSVQMATVYDFIAAHFKQKGCFQIERQQTKVEQSPNWRIMDYGSVIVNIMTQPTREFYSLEKIWHKARKLTFR
ncbi:MAG: ribosome silencing factor [Elusimicrobia bacterium RIFOXYA2_FULL_39_19]|nr:MAG: ribosome silencing factor [Elusimicrobia bacterium RIFOXYA2_FULL_39_19]